MGRRACAAVLVGLACWGWSTSGAAAQESDDCQVGTTPAGYPFEGIEPTSEVLYIGCGSALGKPVEIIAFDESGTLCIVVDWKDGAGGVCPYGPIGSGSAIQLTETGPPYFPYPGYSLAQGVIRADVSSVSVRFRHKGRAQITSATVAQITPELAQRLNQPTPFGFFVAFARGCIDGKHVRAKAFAASGALLGRDRGKGTCGIEFAQEPPSKPPPSP